MDIVEVTWLDNAIVEGWAEIGVVCDAFHNVDNRTHKTMGFLLFEDNDWICVAYSWNAETGQAQSATMINQKNIVDMEVLGHAETIPDTRD